MHLDVIAGASRPIVVALLLGSILAAAPLLAGTASARENSDDYADYSNTGDEYDAAIDEAERDRDPQFDEKRDRRYRKESAYRGFGDRRHDDRESERILSVTRITAKLEAEYRNVHNVAYSSAQGHYHAEAQDQAGNNVRLSVDPWTAYVQRTEIIDYAQASRRRRHQHHDEERDDSY